MKDKIQRIYSFVDLDTDRFLIRNAKNLGLTKSAYIRMILLNEKRKRSKKEGQK